MYPTSPNPTPTASPGTTPLTEPPEEPSKRPVWREVASTLGILAAAGLVALFIIAFVFRSYEVDGPSMQTTLENADKLVIWKVPRSWAGVTGHPYIPKRGDVVVFDEKGIDGGQDDKQLIKRVIGLPGDRVVVKDGSVTIYNKEHPEGFNPDKTLPYGQNIPATTGERDDKLGPDQIFVLGDNRPVSLDSRVFGPIQANQIVGKLVIRVFPLNDAKVF